ncbi:hypothetical protein ACFVXC_23125 [Streptomyces sp. NPDC058257]|uniref:hypothetical protein n=1 Tax=Streptomyces sp. NPDC058257 TaxID=3346409 RepID=UPI0036EC26C1
MDEAAEIIARVADRIDNNGWSICPCGEEHGQSEAGQRVPDVMRDDAELIRKSRAKSAPP